LLVPAMNLFVTPRIETKSSSPSAIKASTKIWPSDFEDGGFGFVVGLPVALMGVLMDEDVPEPISLRASSQPFSNLRAMNS
jgi:hypothetical protein